MKAAYLQYSDGTEINLNITVPDPEDGTFCIHLPEELPDILEKDAYGKIVKATKWIRIIPG